VTALTLAEAEDLAARTLAAIPQHDCSDTKDCEPSRVVGGEAWVAYHIHAADRERVEADLAGLRRHRPVLVSFGDEQEIECDRCGHANQADDPCDDYRDRSDDLLRTARLYGVEAL
jgi:hypothetical protein